LQQEDHCLTVKSAWLIKGVAPPTLKEPLQRDWSSLLVSVAVNQRGQQVSVNCRAEKVSFKTIALWPQLVEPWLPRKWRRQNRLPALANGCTEREFGYQLVVEGIEPETQLYPLPGQKAEIELELGVLGATGRVSWFVDGHWVRTEAASNRVLVTVSGVGQHRIHVMDESGRQQEVSFHLAE
jgi:penicillin-binding protein 1C